MNGVVILEVVQHRIAVLDAPRVGDDDRTERAGGQIVPQEVEAFLARRAETDRGSANCQV